MHLYYTCRKRLLEEVNKKFLFGQFLMERQDGLVFRGQFRRLIIPNMDKKLVEVEFVWLREPRFVGVDKFCQPIPPKWVLVQIPLCFRLRVEYTSYYFQRKRDGTDGKEVREERIKMRTPRNEVCRIFQENDPSNLKQHGDEFLPCYQPPKADSGPED